MNPIPKLVITVTKTADGQHDYVQIMSGDVFTVNVVLVSSHIVVLDKRPNAAPKQRRRPIREEPGR